MTLAELRKLARWHEERAALAKMRLDDLAGGTHAELQPIREHRQFHLDAARGLTQLATAFETFAGLSTDH